MESLLKESYQCDNGQIVSLKPNVKSTFPVLGTTQLFLFLTFLNDLDLTALFKYPNSGLSETNFFSGITLKFDTQMQ